MRRLIVLLIAALMVSCSQQGSNPQRARVDSPSASPTATSSKALTFSAEKVEGGQFDATDLEGKDVALWFYAPW